MNSSPRVFYVAGVQHRPGWEAVVDSVSEEDLKDCRLVGEPSNKFDRYVVKVLVGGKHVGYVPKPTNVDVWALRDSGLKPEAKIIEFNAHHNPWEIFKVQVSFVKQPIPISLCPTSPTTPPK